MKRILRAFDLFFMTIEKHGNALTAAQGIQDLIERKILVTSWTDDHWANVYEDGRVEIEPHNGKWSAVFNPKTLTIELHGIDQAAWLAKYDAASLIEDLMNDIAIKR